MCHRRLSSTSSRWKKIFQSVRTLLQAKWLNPAFSYNGRGLSWGCFLNVVFRCGLHTYSHTGQILNWEIQTPKQFLSSPKAILCNDTVAAAVHSVSLRGVVCGSGDVAGRHSGSLFSPQSDCHALNALRCGADCVAQGRTQDCRIVKIALLLAFFYSTSSWCADVCAKTLQIHFGKMCLPEIHHCVFEKHKYGHTASDNIICANKV